MMECSVVTMLPTGNIVMLPVGWACGLVRREHQLTLLSSVTLLIDFQTHEEEMDVNVLFFCQATLFYDEY